jgi:hypothetical protein
LEVIRVAVDESGEVRRTAPEGLAGLYMLLMKCHQWVTAHMDKERFIG